MNGHRLYHEMRWNVKTLQIRQRFENDPSGIPREIDAFAGVREFESRITQSIKKQHVEESAQYLRIFRDVLQNALVTTDGELRRKAGELAKLSRELKGRLSAS